MVSIEKMNYSNSIEFYVRATGAWLLFYYVKSPSLKKGLGYTYSIKFNQRLCLVLSTWTH